MKKNQNIDIQQTITFSLAVLDIYIWKQKADDLLQAAQLLEPSIQEWWRVVTLNHKNGTHNIPPADVQPTYFMLVAFALENLLKTKIINDNYENLRNRLFNKLPSYIPSHNLVLLAKTAKVDLNISEEDLLCRLSRVSTWSGRYPIPTEPAKLKNSSVYSDGKEYLTACFLQGDVVNSNKFVQRLKSLI